MLGDGRQEKSYLYVQDCVSAILIAAAAHEQTGGAHVYNLGTDETIVVDDSVAAIVAHLGLEPDDRAHGRASAAGPATAR